jgi:hypothetical protein
VVGAVLGVCQQETCQRASGKHLTVFRFLSLLEKLRSLGFERVEINSFELTVLAHEELVIVDSLGHFLAQLLAPGVLHRAQRIGRDIWMGGHLTKLVVGGNSLIGLIHAPLRWCTLCSSRNSLDWQISAQPEALNVLLLHLVRWRSLISGHKAADRGEIIEVLHGVAVIQIDWLQGELLHFGQSSSGEPRKEKV